MGKNMRVDDLDHDDEFTFEQLKTASRKPEKSLSLADQMKVNLVVNDKSELILLHDQQFPFLLNWAEFDADLSKLYFIGFKGTPLELGIKIPKKLFADIRRNKKISTVLIQDKEVVDFYILPLIVRETWGY
jgi:hypothetical protein